MTDLFRWARQALPWQPTLAESLAILRCLEAYGRDGKPEHDSAVLIEVIRNIVRKERKEAIAYDRSNQQHERDIESLSRGRSTGVDDSDPDDGSADMSTVIHRADQNARVEFTNRVAVNLRVARCKSGLSMGQIAEMAGISQDVLRKAESGVAVPSLMGALAICKILGITLDDLTRELEQ